jgi:hypothetical protein
VQAMSGSRDHLRARYRAKDNTISGRNTWGTSMESGTPRDIWMCDHEFGYEIGETDYTDFFDFLAKVGLGI